MGFRKSKRFELHLGAICTTKCSCQVSIFAELFICWIVYHTFIDLIRILYVDLENIPILHLVKNLSFSDSIWRVIEHMFQEKKKLLKYEYIQAKL